MASEQITSKAETRDAVVVHQHVWNPAQEFFGGKKSDRAECHKVLCGLVECPLRNAGQCLNRNIFGPECPYGTVSIERGPTQRSTKFSSWVSVRQKESKEVGSLRAPPKKMSIIGDWVYLPYDYMTMCKSVPFKTHSDLFQKGSPFIPLDSWTIETVETLLDFKPRSVTGSVISGYQKESVPKFVQHIRELDPAMWRKLIERRPHLDKEPNYVGRTAVLRTLNSPIDIPAKNEKYTVRWRWDGEFLITTDRHAYDDTWGNFKAEHVEVKLWPPEDATVVVADNAWVNDDTVFID